MKVLFDGVKYDTTPILKTNLKTFENISKTLNNDKIEYEDKIVYVLKDLTNIPIETLNILDFVQLKQLFDKLTELDKNNLDIINTIEIEDQIFKTCKEFKELEDININRSQHKIIKQYFKDEKNYIAAIMSCYFTIDGSQLIENNEDFKNRLELFNNNIELGTALPFIVKVMESIAIQTGEIINIF